MFRNREGRFWLSKILLIFWEEVCKKYLCIYSLSNGMCHFLLSNLWRSFLCFSPIFDLARMPSIWHSLIYSLLFKLKILQLLCGQMQYNNFCVRCFICQRSSEFRILLLLLLNNIWIFSRQSEFFLYVASRFIELCLASSSDHFSSF